MGQGIHEGFDDEDVVGGAHAAPEGRRDPGRLDTDIVDMDIRKCVRRLCGCFDGIEIQAIGEQGRQVASDDRRAGYAVSPRYGVPLGIESRRQPVEIVGTVHIVLDVFLPSPHHLDRPVDVLRYAGREDGAVSVEAPPEPAAHEVIVNLDGLAGQPRQLGYQLLRKSGCLRSHPDVAALFANMNRAVHRLHGRMREKRSMIDSVETLMCVCQRALRVSVVTRHGSRLL